MTRDKSNIDPTKRGPFKMQYPDISFYTIPPKKCNPFPWLDPCYKPRTLNLGQARGSLNNDKEHDKIEYEEETDQSED